MPDDNPHMKMPQAAHGIGNTLEEARDTKMHSKREMIPKVDLPFDPADLSRVALDVELRHRIEALRGSVTEINSILARAHAAYIDEYRDSVRNILSDVYQTADDLWQSLLSEAEAERHGRTFGGDILRHQHNGVRMRGAKLEMRSGEHND